MPTPRSSIANTVDPSRLLDLRDQAAHAERREPLPMIKANASGEVAGWIVESQIRQLSGVRMLAVKITPPTGEPVHLVFGLDDKSHTNPQSPVTTYLSVPFGHVFRIARTPEVADACARAVTATFQTAEQMLSCGQHGADAWHMVRLAASLFTHDEATTWHDHFPHAQDIRHVWDMREAGFTPQLARTWFGDTLPSDLPTTLTLLRAEQPFAVAGWTREQYLTTSDLVVPPPGHDQFGTPKPRKYLDKRWSALQAEQVTLAHRAGLSPTETARLIREDRFDPAALAMLAALR